MIPIFNFLRAFACFAVVFHHIWYHFVRKEIWHSYFFGDIVSKYILPDGIGMATFFFISGFLIALSLDNIEGNKHSRAMNGVMGDGYVLKTFLIRRAFRLLPVLAFCIAVYIIIVLLDPNMYNDKKVLYSSNIFANVLRTLFAVDFIDVKHFGHRLLLVSWSLAVEYKFYFIAALAWLCFKDARSRLYGMFAFLGILSALVSSTRQLWAYSLCGNVSLIYVCLIGSTTYFYYLNKISQKEFLLLLIVLLAIINNSVTQPGYIPAILVVTIVVLKFSNFGKSKIFKFFADISYSMYLLHMVIFRWILRYSFFTPTFKKLSWLEQTSCCIVILLVLILICYLIYRFIEKPFIKLGYKLTGGVKKI